MTIMRPKTSTRKPICVHIEHAKQGNETHTMSETLQLIITIVAVFLFSCIFGLATSKKR